MTPKQVILARHELVQRLTDERERQGLSHRDIEERNGPSQSCVRKIDAGKWGPTLGTVIAYAAALGHGLELVKRHEDS